MELLTQKVSDDPRDQVHEDHLDVLVHNLKSVHSRPSTASSSIYRAAESSSLSANHVSSKYPELKKDSSILKRSGSFSIQRQSYIPQSINTIQNERKMQSISPREDELEEDYRLYGIR